MFVSISTFHVHTMPRHYRQHPASTRLHLAHAEASLLSPVPLPPPSAAPMRLQQQQPQQELEKRREEHSLLLEHRLYSPVVNTHSNYNDVFSFARSIVMAQLTSA
jgi:hypothetical protein